MSTTNAELDWYGELGGTLQRLTRDLLAGRSDAPATLAELRRGLSKPPMGEPAMWKYLVPIIDRAHGDRAQPSKRVEAAVHHTLAFFALHQQSRGEPMHVTGGPSLGTACRRLTAARGGSPGVRRRFYATATSDSVPELVGHLRGLVTMLRGESIPLDYLRLASAIAAWPRPDGRARHRRRWGLDYETTRAPRADETETSNDTQNTRS